MGQYAESWTEALSEIRTVLESVARSGRVLTYADLTREACTDFELRPQSPELAKLLCELLVEDAANDRPLLSSLVINRLTGRPGKGFFRLARHYYRFSDDEKFWLEELSSLYAFYGASDAKSKAHRRNAVRVADRHLSPEEHILSFFD